MARARAIPDLAAADTYATAAAKIVSVRAREVADHAHDVLDVADIEPVHDMRVATRRLRAALEIFEPCFPPKEFSAALAQVKAIADALGERRDRDVAIAALEELAAGMPAPDRPGIRTLTERLRVEQAEANAALAPFVDAGQLAALSELLSELVAAAEGRAGRCRREGEARQEARSRRAAGRQRGPDHPCPAGRDAAPSPRPRSSSERIDDQHDMRIAAKRLRYILETTEFCFGKPADAARRRARDLQDLLGELHDCDVMLPRVEAHLAELRAEDATAVRELAGDSPDLDPRLAARAQHRTAYRGLELLAVYLQARRSCSSTGFASSGPSRSAPAPGSVWSGRSAGICGLRGSVPEPLGERCARASCCRAAGRLAQARHLIAAERPAALTWLRVSAHRSEAGG